ncbi:MAG: nitrous oxide reductase accessory protein NosL [Bacteroidetes bacterium]|nr:nitrous oxide reductase accessory protein NosL [Bacteroidota bacterium]
MKQIFLLSIVLIALLISSCARKFEPIDYGKDGCAHCKMTIVEKQFAAEIVNEKGRVFKFDDISCMKAFAIENHFDDSKILLFVADYANPEQAFLDVHSAYMLFSESFKSPMNGFIAAFKSPDEATEFQKKTGAVSADWKSLK